MPWRCNLSPKRREIPVSNPLPIELTIKTISSTAGLNGTELATFSHTFSSPGLVVSPLGSRNSGIIPNVLVTNGVANSLDIVPFGVLDLSNINADVQWAFNSVNLLDQCSCYENRALTIEGFLGFPLELDGLKQDNVPTKWVGFVHSRSC